MRGARVSAASTGKRGRPRLMRARVGRAMGTERVVDAHLRVRIVPASRQCEQGRDARSVSGRECAWQDSNLRPCAPEAHALSPELQARWATSVPAVELAHRPVTLALAAPFRISRSTDVEVEVVWVELRAGGQVGYGEAQPQDHYGESIASAIAFLDGAAPLLGDDPARKDEILDRVEAALPGDPAARASIERPDSGTVRSLAPLPRLTRTSPLSRSR